MWFVALPFLSFAPLIRAKRRHTIFTLGVPGPNNLVNIQSFFLPFYQAMAKLSGGLWMWDAASRKWFV
ncbi:hypothetical protein BT69DRAFT_1220859 [Atractiella rhizophila]|nr:hypothetical protein BT69DRAFT_1220859 [Atractiella rhizophila]